MNKNIGIDVGFGYVKVTDGTQVYMFPSVVGEGREIRYNSGLAFDKLLENLIIEIEDEQYFVGELAKRQSQFLQMTVSDKRVTSTESRVLFATALALITGPGNSRSKVNLVTGLPVNEYRQYREEVIEQLAGNHIVKVIYGDHFVMNNIEVEKCKVIPQPFGTVFNQLLTDNGEIERKELGSETIGVIDIGYRTSDFIVSDGLEFVDKLSSSSETGMNTAGRMISQKLREELEVDVPLYQVDQLIERRYFNYNGKEYDINELVDQALTLTANQILSEISTLWPGLWKYDKVFITGGGGIALKDHLEPQIKNSTVISNGSISNVRGYLKIGNRSFNMGR